MRSVTTAHHGDKKQYVPKELKECKFVFVRNDAVRRPFQPPNKGPYEVVTRQDKGMVLKINGKDELIGVDRLKPAFVDQSENQNEEEITTNNESADHQRKNRSTKINHHKKGTRSKSPSTTTRLGPLGGSPVAIDGGIYKCIDTKTIHRELTLTIKRVFHSIHSI